MCNKHGPQLHKVTVGRILYFNYSPRILPSPQFFPAYVYEGVSADNGKWYGLPKLLNLLLEVVVLVTKSVNKVLKVWELYAVQ